MKDFFSLCLNRQSCRNFSSKKVEKEKLIKCIEAARLAPSACNSQPWSFVIVHSSCKVKEIKECAKVLGRNNFVYNAQAFFVVVEEYAELMPQIRGLIDSQFFAEGDVGRATSYLCLSATEQGLATCIMGLFDREKTAKVLDIAKEKKIRAIIAVGYSEDKIREKTRKSFDEIAKFV